MKVMPAIVVVALTAQPWIAHASAAQPVTASARPAAPSADEAAVRSVLLRYKSAIERLDATGTERLFTADSVIFETGGSDGSYSQYLASHLGPELRKLKAFKFSDYKVGVRFEGPVALASESYKYRIETATGEVVDRVGVATSVLKKEDGQWKILSMHNSARTPKAS